VGNRAGPPSRKPMVVQHVRRVAWRVHRGTHLGEPCCRGPCLGVGGIPSGNTVRPSLHPDGRGGGKPAQNAGARPSIEMSGAIAAVGRDPLR
jgi:hypothetical protein